MSREMTLFWWNIPKKGAESEIYLKLPTNIGIQKKCICQYMAILPIDINWDLIEKFYAIFNSRIHQIACEYL